MACMMEHSPENGLQVPTMVQADDLQEQVGGEGCPPCSAGKPHQVLWLVARGEDPPPAQERGWWASVLLECVRGPPKQMCQGHSCSNPCLNMPPASTPGFKLLPVSSLCLTNNVHSNTTKGANAPP